MDTPVATSPVRANLPAAVALIALATLAFAAPAGAEGPHGGAGHGFSGGGMSASAGANAGRAFAAPHFAERANVGAGGYRGYAAPVRSMHGGTYVNNASVAHANFAAGGARYLPGRFAPGVGFHYGRWSGGYWRGGFWPPVLWGASFAWFLPVLPAYCATYWWNSTPYYYYNDVYYTYDPSASGYVVTSPPPAQESSADASAASAPDAGESNSPAPQMSGSPTGNAPTSNGGLFAYPKNGQSEEQQSTDRQECAAWASGQTGADGTGTAMDYQRAMTACLQGRGYSVD